MHQMDSLMHIYCDIDMLHDQHQAVLCELPKGWLHVRWSSYDLGMFFQDVYALLFLRNTFPLVVENRYQAIEVIQVFRLKYLQFFLHKNTMEQYLYSESASQRRYHLSGLLQSQYRSNDMFDDPT